MSQRKAREIFNAYAVGMNGENFRVRDARGFVDTLAVELAEAVAEERREILKLLDRGGAGDAFENLDGAIIDLKRLGADKICIQTIERVHRQIALVMGRCLEKVEPENG